MSNTEHELAEARRSKDSDAIATALVRHANELTQNGELLAACEALDEATDIHQQQQRVYDEARCSHMAATLYRISHKIPEAKQRLKRAQALAESGTQITVSVLTEQAEIATVEHQPQQAVNCLQQAIEQGQQAGLATHATAALRRKMAQALAAGGDLSAAARALEQAFSDLMAAGHRSDAVRVLVEAVSSYYQMGSYTAGDLGIAKALELAELLQDAHALADIHIVQASRAIEQHQLDSAEQLLLQARNYALQATGPLSYISAALGLAELAERREKYCLAYEVLAVGWVTLGDLTGADQAKTVFKPRLLGLRERLGHERFSKIKKDYEQKRRAAKMV